VTLGISAVGNLKNLRPGDCLVLFSRREILRARAEIESHGFSAAVVYGSLPPETRKFQSSFFNDGEKQILVASDCIGLGINFKISRIVFGALRKFDGENIRKLTVSEIRQISGRAGRFEDSGKIACLREDDLPELFHAFNLEIAEQDTEVPMDNLEISSIEKAAIFPDLQKLESFCKEFQIFPESGKPVDLNDGKTVTEILGNFFDFTSGSELFFVSRVAAEKLISVSLALEEISMPLNFRLRLLFAPLPSADEVAPVLTALRSVAFEISKFSKVDLPRDLRRGFWETARTRQELLDLENLHAIADLYCWLKNQDLGEVEDAKETRVALADAISRSLELPGNFLTTDEEKQIAFSNKCQILDK